MRILALARSDGVEENRYLRIMRMRSEEEPGAYAAPPAPTTRPPPGSRARARRSGVISTHLLRHDSELGRWPRAGLGFGRRLGGGFGRRRRRHRGGR